MTSMTDTALPSACADARRPLFGDLRLAAHQVLYEQRSFWRDRGRAFFAFALPVMFVLIFATINRGDHMGHPGALIPTDAFVIPGVLAYAVVMATFANIAADLAIARESGVLKRAQGPPLPTWTFVAARIGSAVIVAVAVSVVTLLLAGLAYGVNVRSGALGGLLLSLVAGTACFGALGVAAVRLISRADSATAITTTLVLPLTFISGVWGEFGGLPRWLDSVGKVFPIEHLAHALQGAFDPKGTGAGIAGSDLLVLGIWCAVGVALGIRALRAELRRS
jgi:ABC-2 type transport system permease protein